MKRRAVALIALPCHRHDFAPMQELESAFVAKRWSEVLDALLRTWRDGHSPEVADAIDTVSSCLDTFVDCPGGASPKARLAAWVAFQQATAPKALRPALRALSRWKRPQLTIALDHLARWPADPRLGAWHVEQLDQSRSDLHLEPVAQSADVRALRRLQTLREACGDSRSQMNLAWRDGLDAAIDALRSVKVKPPPALLAQIAAVAGETLRRQRELRDRLFDAVYAAPDDDGPRAVLADFLLELEDPRGEFISLQLARSRSEDQADAREEDLLGAWGDRWVEPIAGAVLKGVTFRRGFPSACELRNANPETDAREWATIERVSTEGLGARLPGLFFAASRFPALRSLGPVDPSILRVAAPLGLEHLGLNWCSDPDLEALLSSTSFPRLRSISIDAPVRFDPMILERFATAPVAATWRELTCQITDQQINRWARIIATHRGPLTAVVIEGPTWRWELAATPRGLRLAGGRWDEAKLEAEHRSLPIASTG